MELASGEMIASCSGPCDLDGAVSAAPDGPAASIADPASANAHANLFINASLCRSARPRFLFLWISALAFKMELLWNYCGLTSRRSILARSPAGVNRLNEK